MNINLMYKLMQFQFTRKYWLIDSKKMIASIHVKYIFKNLIR